MLPACSTRIRVSPACPLLLPPHERLLPRVAQEMDAAGLPADSVGHTILLMAYEKVSSGP